MMLALPDPNIHQPNTLIQQFNVGGKNNNWDCAIELPHLSRDLQSAHIIHPIVQNDRINCLVRCSFTTVRSFTVSTARQKVSDL